VVEGEGEDLVGRLCADLETGAAQLHYSSREWPDVSKVPPSPFSFDRFSPLQFHGAPIFARLPFHL
jgi:hypothetical protein